MSENGSAGVRLHHRVDGEADAPVVVLGPSLGTDLGMWDAQMGALTKGHRVVRFDLRGHGGSPAPPGPYSVAGLAADVLDTLDEIGVGTFAYCGVSLGGAIGQHLAAERPERLRALVLCCTAARFADARSWHERAARVREEGTGWLVGPSRERWFTDAFISDEPTETERLLTMLRRTSATGYAGCCDALAEFDGRPLLGAVAAPTLVVAGEDDPATPPASSAELAEGIRGAELLVVPAAAHLATVERADVVTPAIVDHLERTAP